MIHAHERIVIVPGTWARDAAWHQPGSALTSYLESRGVAVHRGPDGRGPVWSGDVNGRPWRRWVGVEDHSDWITGGHALLTWIVPPLAPECRLPADDTYIVCHSHGLQVVLYACRFGLRVKRLVSIGSPVRADMLPVATLARPHIGEWLHLYSDQSDHWQWLGAIGDGALGVVRQHPLADVNWRVPGVGHSRILTDPDMFDRVWPAVVDWLRRA